MNQDTRDKVALTRFERERIQKLHEMCDFIEDEISASTKMSTAQFRNIVRMCQGVDLAAFDRSRRALGLGDAEVKAWTQHDNRLGPSDESAVLLARALLCELRNHIGRRPTPRVLKVKETAAENTVAPTELPDGVVLANGFTPDANLDTLPEWQDLSVRLRNAMFNDNRRSLIQVLDMSAADFFKLGNVSGKSLEALVRWCHKHGLRGKFFDDRTARRIIARLEEDAENVRLGDGMA